MTSSIPKDSVPNFEQLQQIVQKKQEIFADVLGRRYVIHEKTEYKISSLMESLKNSIENRKAEELQPILEFIKNATVHKPSTIKGLILKIHDCFRKKIFDQKIKDLEAQIHQKSAETSREGIAPTENVEKIRERKLEQLTSLRQALESEKTRYERAIQELQSKLDSPNKEEGGLPQIDYEASINAVEQKIAKKTQKYAHKGLLRQVVATHKPFGKTFQEKIKDLTQEIVELKTKQEEKASIQKSIQDVDQALAAKTEERAQTTGGLEAKIKELESELGIEEGAIVKQSSEDGGLDAADAVQAIESSAGVEEVVPMTLADARVLIGDKLGEVSDVLLAFVDLIPEEQRNNVKVKIEGSKISFDFSDVRPKTLAIDMSKVIYVEQFHSIFPEIDMGEKGKKRAVFLTFNDSVEINWLETNSISVEGIKITSKLEISLFLKAIISVFVDLSRFKMDAEMQLKGIKLSQISQKKVDLRANFIVNTGWGKAKIGAESAIKKLKDKEKIITALTKYSKESVTAFINGIGQREKKNLAFQLGVQSEEISTETLLEHIEKENIVTVNGAEKGKLLESLAKSKWHNAENVFLYDLESPKA